jgi:hypothetical protein
MCGKETIVSDEYGHKDEKDQHEPGTSNMIVEQIDGICILLTQQIVHRCSKNSVLYMEVLLQMNNIDVIFRF